MLETLTKTDAALEPSGCGRLEVQNGLCCDASSPTLDPVGGHETGAFDHQLGHFV
jgi:uncharacterized protein (DUF779 family)